MKNLKTVNMMNGKLNIRTSVLIKECDLCIFVSSVDTK